MLVWHWVVLEVLPVWPLRASWWGMDALTERTPPQYISGFMLTVALQAGATTLSFLVFFFFLPPWLLSLGFISICPHFASSCGSGAKAEMQTRGEDVCVRLCVCLSDKKREEGWGEGKEKQWRAWQVEEGSVVWASFRVTGRVSGPKRNANQMRTDQGAERKPFWAPITERTRRMGVLFVREQRNTHALMHTLTCTQTSRTLLYTQPHIFTGYKSTGMERTRWRRVDKWPHPWRGCIHVCCVFRIQLPMEDVNPKLSGSK